MTKQPGKDRTSPECDNRFRNKGSNKAKKINKIKSQEEDLQ